MVCKIPDGCLLM